MDTFFKHFFESFCSARGYEGLFKAGVVLMSVALLALSQTGTFLYEKDIAAHKAKFALEVALKLPLGKIECSKVGILQLDCLVAKHEIETLNSTLGLLESLTQICLKFGFALIVFSMVGFGIAPFMNSKSKSNGQKT